MQVDFTELKNFILEKVHGIREIREWVKRYDLSLHQAQYLLAGIYILTKRSYDRKEDLKTLIVEKCDGYVHSYNPVISQAEDSGEIFKVLSEIYFDAVHGEFYKLLIKNRKIISMVFEEKPFYVV